MAKKARFDESGDSEELQALFDSIATAPPVKRHLEVISESDGAGDSPDLQALFDNVSSQYGTAGSAAAVGTAAVATAKAVSIAPRDEAPMDPSVDAASAGNGLFQRLGHLTRALHQALSELGYDQLIEETARAFPDTRQRLSYVAQMTEQAASRVLNATDIARPIQEQLQSEGQALSARWEQVYANQLTPEGFKVLADDTRVFFKSMPEKTAATSAQLMEIMMAQDFQDLTGQVIKRLVATSQNLEQQMLQLLVDFQPGERKVVVTASTLLNGPVVDKASAGEVVTSQQQVDDLLGSLGF